MPTTVTNSIGSGARDYATIALWEDATDINLVSADEVRVGECYNDSEFALGAGVSLAGATTDATRYRHLTTASGQSFADHADKLTNPLKYDQTKGVGLASSTYGATVLYLEEDYSRVSKLQLNVTANANIGIRFENANNSARDCLVDGTYRSYGFDISRGTCVNCIAIVRSTGFAVYGFRFFYYGSNAQKVYNCTAVRPSDLAGTVGAGFRGHSVGLTPIAKNCASFGFTGGAGGFANITTWGTGSDYNATDSASATAGANDLTSLTYADQYENTVEATRDFRVKSGSDIENAGTRDQTNTNDLDIVGQARSTTTPTIGCWEFVSGGGGGGGSTRRRFLPSLGVA